MAFHTIEVMPMSAYERMSFGQSVTGQRARGERLAKNTQVDSESNVMYKSMVDPAVRVTRLLFPM